MMPDPYVLPGTAILKNKFNLTTQQDFREGNTRTTIHFCCQFADEHGFPIDRQLFEETSHYVRTALVAYNAVFSDIGDKSQKQYLEMIIRDGIENGKLKLDASSL